MPHCSAPWNNLPQILSVLLLNLVHIKAEFNRFEKINGSILSHFCKHSLHYLHNIISYQQNLILTKLIRMTSNLVCFS
jgi:regulator of sigma D